MSFFRRVPPGVIEAGRVDGCSWLDVLIRVVVPMSLGCLLTVATFVIIFFWKEFLLALFLTTRRGLTTPVVISWRLHG